MKQTLSFFLLLAAAATARADDWTYADCVAYAREHNISLQKTRLGETSADISVTESKAQWQPSLDFGTTQGFSNTPWGNGNRNSYTSNYALNAAWTVWDGGSRENTIKRNTLLADAARVDTRAAEQSLQVEIMQAYLNALYAAESIDIYEEMAALSSAQAARTLALMEAGKASRVDYAQLKSQAEQDNYALVNARGEYSTRCMQLKELLSIGLDMNVTPVALELTPAQVMAALPPIDESYAMAAAIDPRLESLRISRQSSEADEAIARAGRMPRIGLTAGVGTGYTAPGNAFGTSLKQNFGEQIGLTFSVPILDNRKTAAAVSRARVSTVAAGLDIDDRLVTLASQVENWYVDTTTAQSRFSAAMEQLAAAEATDSLTNEKFEIGYVDPIELMTAHNALTQARHTVAQAKYLAILGLKMIEYYRTASITLN